MIARLTKASYDYPNVINFAWHPAENIASFTTSDGEVFIYKDFVPSEFAPYLEKTLQSAPLIHDPLKEVSGNTRKLLSNGTKQAAELPTRRRGTPDSLDDILGPDEDNDNADDFVSDDDGAGYASSVNEFGKRRNGHLGGFEESTNKRQALIPAWRPRIHEPFQSGSTPWRGKRRYLCKSRRSGDCKTRILTVI